jgi:predicted lipid-binding transport protein (Tim44 family)
MGGRYAVIVCPHCATPIGADLQKQTMTCLCGQTLELIRIKPKFVSNSPSKVAEAVAHAKSQAAEGKMILPKQAPPKGKMGKIAAKAREIKDTQERLCHIASELTKAKKEFSIEDLEKIHELIGKDSATDMLVAMREGGLVYEVGKGKYRAV